MKRDCSTCLYGPLIKENLCPHRGTICGGLIFNYDNNIFDLFFIRPSDFPEITAVYKDENISYKDLGYPKWVPSMDKLRITIASVENRLNESRNKQGAPVAIASSTLSDILVILKWVQGNEDE